MTDSHAVQMAEIWQDSHVTRAGVVKNIAVHLVASVVVVGGCYLSYLWWIDDRWQDAAWFAVVVTATGVIVDVAVAMSQARNKRYRVRP
jgi:drug/metabolite transporter superfamily protein YnfA